MLFKNSVRTSKRTPHFTITKINWLTLFKFKILNISLHVMFSKLTRSDPGGLTSRVPKVRMLTRTVLQYSVSFPLFDKECVWYCSRLSLPVSSDRQRALCIILNFHSYLSILFFVNTVNSVFMSYYVWMSVCIFVLYGCETWSVTSKE
jgi:hypothetical protein